MGKYINKRVGVRNNEDGVYLMFDEDIIIYLFSHLEVIRDKN